MPFFISKVNCHPYPCDIWYTNSERMFNAKRTEITGDKNHISNFLGCVSCSESRMQMVIGVFDGGLPTLVHEVSHAVINVFYPTGMSASVETTEAFAYLYESLFEQCHKLHTRWGDNA